MPADLRAILPPWSTTLLPTARRFYTKGETKGESGTGHLYVALPALLDSGRAGAYIGVRYDSRTSARRRTG
jgi:hypothetical protein